MKFKNAFNQQKIKGLILSLLFIFLILGSVLVTRYVQEKPVFVAGESYYNLRIAEELSEDPFYNKDLVQGVDYYKEPYQITLATLLNIGLSPIMITLIFGVLFGIFFYLLLIQLGFAHKNGEFATMLLGVTPAFIVLFTSLSKLGFVLLLSVLAANFFFAKNYWAYPWKISGKLSFISSMIVLSIIAITSFFAFIITVIMLIILTLYSSKGIKTLALAVSPAMLIVFSMILFNNYLPHLRDSFDFQILSLKESFSVLGSSLGLELFMLLFFFIGLGILWSHFRQTRLYHLLALMIIGASLFSPTLRAYASLIIIAYCVVALKHLYYRKWELEVIQSGTMLLLVCALIFSALSQITLLINSEPSIESLSALDELKTYPEGVVFSQRELLSSVQYFSGKKTLLSEKYEREELTEYLSILGSSRLTEAKLLIEKNNIKYFLITPQMKDEFWENKEVELVFLLHNSGSFQKRYDWQGYEIWEYVA